MTSIPPTPDDRLAPREDAGPDPIARYQEWVGEARQGIDTRQLDQSAPQLYAAFVEHAKAQAEIDKELDRAAYGASRDYREKINGKRAELRAAHEANINTIIDGFDRAAESVESCMSTEVTAADLPIAKDPVHAATIQRQCEQFPRLAPQIAVETVRRDVIARGDKAAAAALIPEVRTAIELGSSGRKPYYANHIGRLMELADELEAVSQCKFSVFRKVAQETVHGRRGGLRSFLQILEKYAPDDPILPQLAAGALKDWGTPRTQGYPNINRSLAG